MAKRYTTAVLTPKSPKGQIAEAVCKTGRRLGMWANERLARSHVERYKKGDLWQALETENSPVFQDWLKEHGGAQIPLF